MHSKCERRRGATVRCASTNMLPMLISGLMLDACVGVEVQIQVAGLNLPCSDVAAELMSSRTVGVPNAQRERCIIADARSIADQIENATAGVLQPHSKHGGR